MQNRKSIIENVQKQFFRYGIKSLRMEDIASQLRISKKTLYEIVENKEGLVELVANTFVEEQKTIVQKICQQSKGHIQELVAITKYISDLSKQLSDSIIHDLKKYYPEYWRHLLSFYHEFLFNKVKANIEQGIKIGLYQSSLTPDSVTKFYLEMLIILSREKPLSDTIDNMELYLDLFLRGVASMQGIKIYNEYFGERPIT